VSSPEKPGSADVTSLADDEDDDVDEV